jgi:phage terminase Nu1 subunit (DNA packaging protein)
MLRYNQTELTKKLKSEGFKYSLQRINKLVKDGRLPIGTDGLIDYDQAVSLIKEIKATASPGQQINIHKAKKEKFLAELREMEVKEKRGQLVDINIVKQTFFSKARIIRDQMLNIPSRIAPILAAESDQFIVENLLKTEISKVLEELTYNGNGKASTTE